MSRKKKKHLVYANGNFTDNSRIRIDILVITVAHNPLRASTVPVYTNQCKQLINRKTSNFKQFEGEF